ncbi:MAG: DHH family phosphoesterase [Bacteroidales bacterium]
MRNNTGKYNKQLSELLNAATNIVLISHYNPDGDAIGSMLGMNRYLQWRGKSPVMISPDNIPGFLKWMKGSKSIVIARNTHDKAAAYIRRADLLIMMDFNNIDRTGDLKAVISKSEAKKVLIDHHPGPDVDADMVISEPSYSSTAELIFILIKNIEGEPFIDKEFIEPIYVGMVTDTGNFSYGTFNGDTLRNVALMLDSGLDRDAVSSRIYDNFSINRLRLQGFALYERLVYLKDSSAAYIYLERDDLARFKHAVGDTEGFVNLPLSVKDIFISALFIEKKDHIKVSLRSKGDFNASQVAVNYFKGGGHRNAAGGRYDGTMKQCRDYFEELAAGIKESVKNKPPV